MKTPLTQHKQVCCQDLVYAPKELQPFTRYRLNDPRGITAVFSLNMLHTVLMHDYVHLLCANICVFLIDITVVRIQLAIIHLV